MAVENYSKNGGLARIFHEVIKVGLRSFMIIPCSMTTTKDTKTRSAADGHRAFRGDAGRGLFMLRFSISNDRRELSSLCCSIPFTRNAKLL